METNETRKSALELAVKAFSSCPDWRFTANHLFNAADEIIAYIDGSLKDNGKIELHPQNDGLFIMCGGRSLILDYNEVEDKTWDEATAYATSIGGQLLTPEQVMDILIPHQKQINAVLSKLGKTPLGGCYWTNREVKVYDEKGAESSASNAWLYYTFGTLYINPKPYQLRARATLAF